MKRVINSIIKRFIPLIIILLFINNIQTFSNRKEDSLKLVLKSCSSKDSVLVFSELANINLNINPDMSIELGRKTLIIAERINDNKLRAIAYTSIGKGFEYKKNYDLALSYYKDACLLTQPNNKEAMADLYNNIGIVFYKIKEFDSALTYYNLSLNIKKQNGDDKQRAKTLINIASLYLRIKDYKKAKENFKLLLDIETKLGDKKQIAYIYNYLGFLNLKLNKYDLTKP
ncbi:MAG: tetratricopeptide repeat protein [Chlorobi bacterium]|nr:tetratricopeptide repeat protein [Chlorobiota bacterium]